MVFNISVCTEVTEYGVKSEHEGATAGRVRGVAVVI